MAASLQSYIPASDVTFVTENASVLIPVLVPNINDTIAISDNPTAQLISFIGVQNEITAIESVSTQLVSFISANDTIVVTENTTENILSYLNIEDTAIVTDQPSVLITASDLTLTIAETVAVGDQASINILSFISAVDIATVSEQSSVMTLSLVSIAETITTQETVAERLLSFVSVQDSANVAETVFSVLGSFIQCADAVFVSEQIQTQIGSFIQASDSVAITDSAALLPITYGRFQFVVYDSAGNIAEVTDTTSLSAASWYYVVATYTGTQVQISVNGANYLSNSTSITAASPADVDFRLGAEGANHSGGVTNYITGREDEFGYWKNHALTQAEVTDLYNGGAGRTFPFGEDLVVTAQDSISVSDQPQVSLPILIVSASDSITAGESVSVSIESAPLSLMAADSVTVTDGVASFLVSFVFITETIVLSEGITLSVAYCIQASDIASTVEAMTVSIVAGGQAQSFDTLGINAGTPQMGNQGIVVGMGM